MKKYNSIVLKDEEEEDVVKISKEELIKVQLKNFVEVRNGGDFRGKAFYLTPDYDWTLGEDSQGELILIPTIIPSSCE